MRPSSYALALLSFGIITQADAGIAPAPLASSQRADFMPVQMRCTPNSCIDQRTGAYTQSHCDYNGCRPLGGVVGRVGPNGYDSAYDRSYGYDGGYDRSYRRRYYRD
jgi:hypothetical protein